MCRFTPILPEKIRLLEKVVRMNGMNHVPYDKAIMIEVVTAVAAHVANAQILLECCAIMNKLTFKQFEKMVILEEIEKCFFFMQALQIHQATAEVICESVCISLRRRMNEW